MANFKDEIGNRYSRLIVLERAGSSPGRFRLALWICNCDCGNQIIVKGNYLRKGATRSCGCLQKEEMSKRTKKHGQSHGQGSKWQPTRSYRSWKAMRTRCTNPNHKYYYNYGGRGIKICDRWDSFENFFADMGERPEGMTMDRIDNDGNYEPSNCCWSTPKQQRKNQRG